MRVAFALTQSLDSPSGLGRYGPITRELARLGFEVEVYALHYDWPNQAQQVVENSGARVAYVGPMHVRKEGPRKLYYGSGKLLAVTLSATLRLARALYRSHADAIHLGKPQPMNALAARLAHRGRPIYCDCDDYEAATNRFAGGWQKQIVRSFEDGVAGYARGLTTNTHFTQHRYERLGYPAQRILYVPNGVDRERFSTSTDPQRLRKELGLPDGCPIILYLGTMSRLSHGVDLLIRAFALARRAMPAAKLLLAGGGEDFDELQRLAGELGVSEATIFAGRIAPDRAPDYYRLATVSVDPVRDDPVAQARSPLKVVESLVMGTPVVTSPVGDRADALRNGETGELVAPASADSLAEGILRVVTDAARRREMTAAALRDRERWFWDHLVRDFAQVYSVS